MPISDIQNEILRQLAANRSPDSYLAGATVLHRSESSPRYSQDLDFFHDIEDSVAQCAELDAATLLANGHDLQWLMRTPTFYRAVVTFNNQQLKLEWAQDSAFRFFPVTPDPQCGFRLHDADAATNKMLALAGRNEIRDLVDILHLNETYLSLGAMAWAACGKDPGFTPEFLLEQANRHTAYTQAELDHLSLRLPLDLQNLKRKWLDARETAQRLVDRLPPAEIGCLYLGPDGTPVTPDPASARFTSLQRHTGKIHGTWPTIHTYVATKPSSSNKNISVS